MWRSSVWVLAWGVWLMAAGGARFARGVELGGKTVPRERFVVYLLIGHSNMAGRDAAHADTETHPRCWNYRWYADEQWVAARETRQGLRGLTPRGTGGPGMAFLKLMAKRYRGYHFGVILNANSAATTAGGDNSYTKGRRLYREIVSAARAVRDEATLGGILCMLGVNEHRDAELAASFCQDTCQMVRDMRADLGEPKLPMIIGQYEAGSRGGYDPRGHNARVVIRQIYQIPRAIEHVGIVDSRGIEMRDDHHYTFYGHAEWCRRAIAILGKKKWFPPPGARPARPRPPKPAPVRVVRPRRPAPPPEPDTWPVTRQGLIFLWENAKAGNRITDAARGKPRPCRLTSRGYAIVGPFREMDTSGGSFIAQDADDEVIYEACRQTDQITLEAFVRPHDAVQKDAYLVSFVPDRGPANFALVQDAGELLLKIRLGRWAKEPLTVDLCEMEPGRARHVLVSSIGGLLTCYVNGRRVASRRDVGGGFRGWVPARLVFGDSWRGGHDWRGLIEGVCLYNRYIDSTQARLKSNLYRQGLLKRQAPPRVHLDGRLLAKSKPTGYTGVYGQALILYRYEVVRVTRGQYAEKEIQVLHWAGLDEKSVRAVLGRRVGQTYPLVVEPAEAHGELAAEKIGADAEDIDLERYYDVARPMPEDEPPPGKARPGASVPGRGGRVGGRQGQ